LGGWTAAKAFSGKEDRIKGDERILGDGDFVQEVLEGIRTRLRLAGTVWDERPAIIIE
jgi:hypothetical protein